MLIIIPMRFLPAQRNEQADGPNAYSIRQSEWRVRRENPNLVTMDGKIREELPNALFTV